MGLKLRALERFRWRALKNGFGIVCIGVPLLAAVAFVVLSYETPYSWDDLPGWTLLVVSLGVLLIGFLVKITLEDFREKFLSVFFKEMGTSLSYEPMPETKDLDPNRFYELGLVDHYRTAFVENLISGTCEGHVFSWGRVRLTEHIMGSESVSETNAFLGILIRIQDVVSVARPIKITPRKGKIGDFFVKRRQGLQKIEIADKRFSSFSLYSETPEDARALVSPRFIEKFDALKTLFGKEALFDTESIEAAFCKKDFLLAIPFFVLRGDKFLQTPRVFVPLAKQRGIIDRLFAQYRFIEDIMALSTSMVSPPP